MLVPLSTQTLEVLHSDVCVYPISMDGAQYAVTLMDEYTGYTRVCILRHKYEVENALRGTIM